MPGSASNRTPRPRARSRRSGPGADALAGLRSYLARDPHLVVGLMTGTSADAVDAALVRFEGLGLESTHQITAYRETPLDDALRREVLAVARASSLEPERLMRLDAALGECYAAAVFELLAGARVEPGSGDAIGPPGRNVRHPPRGSRGPGFPLPLGPAPPVPPRPR